MSDATIARKIPRAGSGSSAFGIRERARVRHARWRARIAVALRGLADLVSPPPSRSPQHFGFEDVIELAGATRLDRDLMSRGRLRMRYCATDPVWKDIADDGRFVDLREHVRRLCMSIDEIAAVAPQGDWTGVAHNLRTDYSITDLFAETDLDSASMWCNSVAEFEAANGEVTEKYLAAIVVFTFVWLAYEGAVDALCAGKAGKGARGRELIVKFAGKGSPCLRVVLYTAIGLDPGGTDLGNVEMRRMLKLGSIPGIAAEHLRQFRNRMTHGDLPKPDPMDWGAGADYFADQDPQLRRFSANTRLLLLLLQILAREAVDEELDIRSWLEDDCDLGGMRLEEVLGLRWDRVDLVDGFINLDTSTKTGKTRDVPIMP